MNTQKKHWLLLRGLGRDERHWGEFVALFKENFPDDEVITLDTCGNGRFAGMKSPMNISAFTEHCRNTLELHGQPIHLVALSLGGMIAMDWAQRYPKELASVTLINTSAANLTSMTKRINFSSLGKLIWAILVRRNDKGIEQAILAATSNQALDERLLDEWTDYRGQSTTSVSNLLRQLFAASQFKLETIEAIPILVLSSKHDRLVSSAASQAIAEHLQCSIEIHPEAGHDLPLDDGLWIISKIKQSLLPL